MINLRCFHPSRFTAEVAEESRWTRGLFSVHRETTAPPAVNLLGVLRGLGATLAVELPGAQIVAVTTLQDFAGRTALVTGASRGLGRAVAARLLERGASVAVNVRDQARAEATVRELGGACVAVAGDLEDMTVVESLVERTLAEFGRLDILINNAALPFTTRFEQITPDEWRRAVEINLTVPFLLTQAAVPAMKAQGYGRIVNISSTAGRMVSTLGGAHYTATKTGLLGLTRAAAKELGKYGITVNAVTPGMIDTELTRESANDAVLERLAQSFPIPRLGTSLEVADVICFAASEAAGYITGATFDINGGDLMM